MLNMNFAGHYLTEYNFLNLIYSLAPVSPPASRGYVFRSLYATIYCVLPYRFYSYRATTGLTLTTGL